MRYQTVKSALMTFNKNANLKYKYENQNSRADGDYIRIKQP